jgi:hypothetical protein
MGNRQKYNSLLDAPMLPLILTTELFGNVCEFAGKRFADGMRPVIREAANEIVEDVRSDMSERLESGGFFARQLSSFFKEKSL